MGISSAVEAYRQSAYNRVEHDIGGSIGAAGNPLFGGTWSGIKAMGNDFARPFKVTKALVFGGSYPTDQQHVPQSAIPQDVQDTPYAEALNKTRDLSRKSADLRAKSVGELLHGNVGGFFRERRAAAYNDDQKTRVVLPDERAHASAVSSTAGLATAVGASVGMRYLAHAALEGMHNARNEAVSNATSMAASVPASSLGELAAPAAFGALDVARLAFGV